MNSEITISGFSYVRNGIEMGYPFLEAIQSALPICDEFIAVVGDSRDGTREAILALNSPKIKIVDTVWDMNLRTGGKIFAQQSNAGVDAISGKWGFHIQADELIHENDLHKIKDAIYKYDSDPEVEGFLFPFMNFWGGYNYIRTSRKVHRNEIRVFKNDKVIRAYRDSQGFRVYTSKEAYENGEKGRKLNVVKLNIPVFHYSYVRPPKLMTKKGEVFHSFYDPNLVVDEAEKNEFKYESIDKLEEFKGTHPKLMEKWVKGQDWTFVYDKKKATMPFKYKVLHFIEDLTGYRFFEYKNYRLIKK
ncbi:hypothetical protein [Desertivirga arenae]|uniref:hypothetical protein n=1 Tax=Desertivirga arenae TaxID=2810309 RepID=UPI001A95B423|nr:hypothetical protein [Pedobacter sp. SYSU D00823]